MTLKNKQLEELLRKLEKAQEENKSVQVFEQFSSEIRKVDDDKKMVTICFSSENPDRHGTILVQKGMNTKHFKKNPSFLKNHENKIESILGNVKNIRKDEKDETKSLADFYFDFDTPFGETAYKLYKNGTLRAVSVGFIPTAWEWIRVNEKDKYETLHFTKWELTEISSVAVGSNRDALKKSLDAGEISQEDVERFSEAPEIRIIESDKIPGKIPEDSRSVEEMKTELQKQLRVFADNHEVTKTYRKLLKVLKERFDFSGSDNEVETIERIIELAKTDFSDYDNSERKVKTHQKTSDKAETVEHRLSPEETISLAKDIL